MERPRIRHIAINVADREKTAEYYKTVFHMEEKHRGPGGTIYLSDGHLDLALISTTKYPWGIHHFGFKVDSVKGIEEAARTTAEAIERLANRCGSPRGRRLRAASLRG